jgi:excisionase family DNA binding protein
VDTKYKQERPRTKEDGVQAEITREWVTYKQAEEISGLSRTTLWKLLSAGEIKAARVGRAVRINRRSLEGYLERASQGSHKEEVAMRS